MRRTGIAAGLGLAALLCQASYAQQQQVEWKQTINTPKGLNLPKDVKGDVLGIELGDTYAEVRPNLEKLAAESVPPKPAAPPNNADVFGMSEKARAVAEARRRESEASMGDGSLRPLIESRNEMRFQVPGGSISAGYVGQIVIERRLPGSTAENIKENIKVRFSAPSSGQQVVGIERRVAYPAQSDQPLASDIVASLKAKFKGDPKPLHYSSTGAGIYFDNGQVFVPTPPAICFSQYEAQGNLAQYVQGINPTGHCDVVVAFTYQPGISANHVSSFTLVLSDNERAKANLTADLAFLNGYVQSLQNSVRGAAPKL